MILTLKDKDIQLSGVTTFKFAPEKPVIWRAGQYIKYHLPHQNSDERGDSRWFTISSAPFEQDIWLSTRVDAMPLSSFKQHLISLEPGDKIEAGEPEGDFTLEDTSQDYIFIIGGIGITPIRSILKQLNHDTKSVRAELLWANRSVESVPFKDEFDVLAKTNQGLKISYFYGEQRIDRLAIEEVSAKLNNPIYYVSGPEPMVEAFEDSFKDMGIEEAHTKFDYFPGYEANKG